MGKYKKCPRCELNYILSEEEMCDVCKAELGLETKIVLLDDIIDDEEPLKLCPICKTNYIGMEEKMCESCFNHETQEEILDADDDDWRAYLDDDPDDVVEDGDIPLEELEQEFDDDDLEDEENQELELDDYPDDLMDDFEDYDDLDDEDIEDEEDEEDEDF